MAAWRQDKVLADSVKALRNGGKRAQIAALHALGRLDDPKGIPALLSALDSKDPDVRALATGKLVFLNNKSVVPALIKALDDKEPRVRQHAIYALQRLKVRTAADKIALLLRRDRDRIVRFNAALALAAVGGRKHMPALVQALNDRDPNVVVTALRALAGLAPRQVSDHILRLARNAARWNGPLQGQQEAILHLLRGSLGRKDVLALLRKTVNDGMREARSQGKSLQSTKLLEVSRLLARAGDATGVPVLMEALKGGEYSQEKAVVALAMLKEKSAVPRIIDTALQNGFFPIKLKTIAALGEIGDPRALPVLASLFNDRVNDFTMDRTHVITKDDPDIRLTALAAMAKIARESLREAARSADPFARKRAGQLLKAL